MSKLIDRILKNVTAFVLDLFKCTTKIIQHTIKNDLFLKKNQILKNRYIAKNNILKNLNNIVNLITSRTTSISELKSSQLLIAERKKRTHFIFFEVTSRRHAWIINFACILLLPNVTVSKHSQHKQRVNQVRSF